MEQVLNLYGVFAAFYGKLVWFQPPYQGLTCENLIVVIVSLRECIT